jgi:hypothetical protein
MDVAAIMSLSVPVVIGYVSIFCRLGTEQLYGKPSACVFRLHDAVALGMILVWILFVDRGLVPVF